MNEMRIWCVLPIPCLISRLSRWFGVPVLSAVISEEHPELTKTSIRSFRISSDMTCTAFSNIKDDATSHTTWSSAQYFRYWESKIFQYHWCWWLRNQLITLQLAEYLCLVYEALFSTESSMDTVRVVHL